MKIPESCIVKPKGEKDGDFVLCSHCHKVSKYSDDSWGSDSICGECYNQYYTWIDNELVKYEDCLRDENGHLVMDKSNNDNNFIKKDGI